MDRLPVYFEGRLVGQIEVSPEGPSFSYDRDWMALRGAFPISTAIPFTSDPVGPGVFTPWAANLLPESEHLRTVGQFLGVARTDVVAILSEIGRDTAGALSIGNPGSSSNAGWKVVASEADLERIINELPHKPFLVGDEGVSMSLAGAQTKLPVAVTPSGQIAIPTNGAPSTHILKPDAEKLWGAVQNEAFCLRLAALMGIDTAEVTTGKAGSRSYLLVKRYDRVERDGRFRRVHQEDFCQALLKPPSTKYEANQTGVKGPTFAQMINCARRSTGAQGALKMLDMLIFNVIACNTDAHAKNNSMIITGRGARMAPLYDVLCASAWANVTKNLAQKIAGKNRGDHIKGRHWQRMAAECGFRPQSVLARVEAMCASAHKNVQAAIEEVEAMPAGGNPGLKLAAEGVTYRASMLTSGLREIEREPEVETDLSPSIRR